MDLEDAIEQVKSALVGPVQSPHLDGYITIKLRAYEDHAQSLYFVETGANGAGIAEQHCYQLIWAKNRLSARNVAKAGNRTWHVDTLFDISAAARSAGFSVDVKYKSTDDEGIAEVGCYKPF